MAGSLNGRGRRTATQAKHKVDGGLRKYGNAERRKNLVVIQDLTRKNKQLEFRKAWFFEVDTTLEVKDCR
jgi:hypothetical protein